MARKTTHTLYGRIVQLEHSSKILKDNPLGDPWTRSHSVYLPPAYLSSTQRKRFPVLFDLVGYTGSGGSHTGWRSFDENVPERLDRLIGEGLMPPCIVVFPDCFTALGGNQYINSLAMGRWADFLIEERNVLAMAVDTASLDYGPTTDFPVHTSWLGGGRWGIENVANLAELPPKGATLVCGAPKIEGATGGHSRILALV